MNELTWNKLIESGLTEQSQIRIDFFYASETKESAHDLERFLTEQTDYETSVDSANGTEWIITGKTQATTISFEILNQWVEWMIIAGAQFNCIFDGWGVEL